MNKIKGLIMIFIALFFIFVSIKAVVSVPESESILRSAVWVEDAKVHPENEGKVVAAVYTPESLGGAVDPELGLTFNGPFVNRRVETADASSGDLTWVQVAPSSQEALQPKAFFGAQDAGILRVDAAFSPQILGGRDFQPHDVKVTDRARFAEYRFAFNEIDSKLYILPATPPEREYRVTYKIFEAGDFENFVVVGRQVGDTLERAPELDSVGVFQDAKNIDDAVGSDRSSLIGGLVVVDLICLTLLVYGVRKLRE